MLMFTPGQTQELSDDTVDLFRNELENYVTGRFLDVVRVQAEIVTQESPSVITDEAPVDRKLRKRVVT
jgi:hypothetical protein